MVDLLIVISIFLTVTTFVVLFIFIRRLEIESIHLPRQGKNRMVSLSARRLPFEDISLSDKEDVLKISVKSSSSFSRSYSCYVAANELKNAFVNKKNNGKTLLETAKVLSLWTSESKVLIVTEDENNITTDKFYLKDIPGNVFEQLKLLKREEKKDFCSFAVYLEIDSIDGLTDNDIVSMLALFSVSSSSSMSLMHPTESYMETLSGNIYPIKKLFSSGVQSSNEIVEEPLTQLCIICYTNPVTRVSLPCRHASVCKSCYHRLEDHCPVCRERITSYFPIMDESFLPATEQELRDNISTDIRSMGWWEFIKSVWNAG